MGRWSDSNTWCDFGGRRELRDDGSDESICSTAARECHEELMGLLTLNNDDSSLPHDNSAALLQHLTNGQFHTLMLHQQMDGATYATFALEVPWQPQLPDLFQQTHDRLQNLYYQSLATGYTTPVEETHPATRGNRVALPYLEKTAVRFFSTPEIVRAFDAGILVRRYSGRDEGLRRGFRARMFVALKELGIVPAGWSPIATEPVSHHRMVWTTGDGTTSNGATSNEISSCNNTIDNSKWVHVTKHVRGSRTLQDNDRIELASLLARDF